MKKQPKPAKVKPQELWEVGVAALREHVGRTNGDTWNDVRRNKAQLVGWRAVADYINKNFVRKSLIILAILPISVVPAEAALRTL